MNRFEDVGRPPIVALVAVCLACVSVAFSFAAEPLPLPEPMIPAEPPIPPTVITSGGQRLMLEQADVRVAFDPDTQSLTSNRPGWWVINYPLDRIAGLETRDRDGIAVKLFGKPSNELKNWYLRTAGDSVEPASPVGPGPIVLHPDPDLIVDRRHAAASDSNKGTADAPLMTISAAVAKAIPGNVIHVYPGIYRETVSIDRPGTKAKPILLEGIRDSDGAMPTISGNDLAPVGAWKGVKGHPGVWRADNWVGKPSNVTLDGRLLRERATASQLAEHETSLNYAHPELAFPRLSGEIDPREGNRELGSTWTRKPVDGDGWLQLGAQRGVFYLSTWLWQEPGKTKEVWDPRFPEPISGLVAVDGLFRAGRQSGSGIDSQLNLYRLWINGALMPASGRADEPTANSAYGQSGDQWQRLPLREGWNHLVVALDSRRKKRKDEHRLRFHVPTGGAATVSSATEPADKSRPASGRKQTYVTEWMVLRAADIDETADDRGVYIRMPAGEDPNESVLDMGSREQALSVKAPWWTIRGLEFVHGSQFQQRSLTTIGAPAVTLEHCLFRETEVRMLSVTLSAWDQTDPMSVVRGNYFLSPGSLGIGASGSSDELTPENQSTTAPGRGRMLVEYNVVRDNNRGGYKRMWESGAMKFFRCTGCVIRNNTILDGDGPGIWLDWEHYNNRLEGNFVRGVRSLAVGTEASPGPNLFANNVAVDIRDGGAWFKYGLLAWSSARVWAVHNTLDTPHGMMFAEGGDDRNTVWKKLPERQAAVFNNLVIGKPESFHRGRIGWVLGNRFYGPQDSGVNRYSKWDDPKFGERVESSLQMGGDAKPPMFQSASVGDYRFSASHDAAQAGVSSAKVETDGRPFDPIKDVRHDFFGLPRFPAADVAAGAFRLPHAASQQTTHQLEIEWTDGTMERR